MASRSAAYYDGVSYDSLGGLTGTSPGGGGTTTAAETASSTGGGGGGGGDPANTSGSSDTGSRGGAGTNTEVGSTVFLDIRLIN